MVEYLDPIEEPDAIDVMRAKSMVARMQKYAGIVFRSSVDRMLRKKANPYERCGAYIVHSMNVLVEAGEPTEALFERHADMVEMLTEIKRETLEQHDRDNYRSSE
ncbi:MAG: hypothetical protein Aurels2KO_56010 [Aureliella sp.]